MIQLLDTGKPYLKDTAFNCESVHSQLELNYTNPKTTNSHDPTNPNPNLNPNSNPKNAQYVDLYSITDHLFISSYAHRLDIPVS